MNRGLAVFTMVLGAVVAWAGISDNSVRNAITAPFDRKVKLNKGHAGLDAVIFYGTLYLTARLAAGGAKLIPIPPGGGGGGGEAPPAETPPPVEVPPVVG